MNLLKDFSKENKEFKSNLSSCIYPDYTHRRFTEKSPQFLRFVSVTESHTYITPMCMYRVSLVSQYITIPINSRWISWFSSFYPECLNQDRYGQFKNSEIMLRITNRFQFLTIFFQNIKWRKNVFKCDIYDSNIIQMPFS